MTIGALPARMVIGRHRVAHPAHLLDWRKRHHRGLDMTAGAPASSMRCFGMDGGVRRNMTAAARRVEFMVWFVARPAFHDDPGDRGGLVAFETFAVHVQRVIEW